MINPAYSADEDARLHDLLQRVADAVAGGSENIFQALIRCAAEALGTDYAFIGETLPAQPGYARIFALYNCGQFEPEFEYQLESTPCNGVINQTFRFYRSDVQRMYSDPQLKMLAVSGYAAIPLYNSAGVGIGLMGVMHRGALTDESLTAAILRILSVRAAVELERRDALEAQRKAEAERGRVEAQLRQSQKMEAIGQLTGGIAHDFNNILTGVMGYIVMAQERNAVARDAQTEKYLERAQRAVQRARDLIQQMLTFSRGQRSSARALDLAPLVRESVKLLESSLPSSVEIHTDLTADLPPIRLDPVQFEQVLMNLCINARDAMNGQGRLDIALRLHDCPDCVCTSCRKTFSGRQIVLTVSDTGAGIPAELLDRIFEPFFTTKEVGKGSGMGLAMVHGIVHEHGGHVLVESLPDQGTRFHVMCPYPLAAAGNGADDIQPARTDQKVRLTGRVMLVDDDATAREFMFDRLNEWGLAVTSFENGERALDHLRNHADSIDVAILDQTMPCMTGLELARRLLLHRPDLPMLLYTGYTDTDLDSQIKGAGIHALLKKPIVESELLARLRELL